MSHIGICPVVNVLQIEWQCHVHETPTVPIHTLSIWEAFLNILVFFSVVMTIVPAMVFVHECIRRVSRRIDAYLMRRELGPIVRTSPMFPEQPALERECRDRLPSNIKVVSRFISEYAAPTTDVLRCGDGDWSRRLKYSWVNGKKMRWCNTEDHHKWRIDTVLRGRPSHETIFEFDTTTHGDPFQFFIALPVDRERRNRMVRDLRALRKLLQPPNLPYDGFVYGYPRLSSYATSIRIQCRCRTTWFTPKIVRARFDSVIWWDWDRYFRILSEID